MHRGAWRKKIPKTSRQVSSLLPGQKFMSQYVTVKKNGEKFGVVPDIEKEKINMNEEEKSFEDILENSLLSAPATERDIVDLTLTASPQQPDKKSREVQLLQSVIDKYGEKLGDVTVGNMVSELISSKQATPAPISVSNNKKGEKTPNDAAKNTSKSDSEKTDRVVEKIREDTRKILKIVTARNKENNVSFDEVYAYVEAYYHKPNRVQLIVDEFLDMHEDGGDERSSSPEIIEVENQSKVKGKGVGKNSKKGNKRSADGENDTEENKKIKLTETESNNNETNKKQNNKNKITGEKKEKEKQRKKAYYQKTKKK